MATAATLTGGAGWVEVSWVGAAPIAKSWRTLRTDRGSAAVPAYEREFPRFSVSDGRNPFSGIRLAGITARSPVQGIQVGTRRNARTPDVEGDREVFGFLRLLVSLRSHLPAVIGGDDEGGAARSRSVDSTASRTRPMRLSTIAIDFR